MLVCLCVFVWSMLYLLLSLFSMVIAVSKWHVKKANYCYCHYYYFVSCHQPFSCWYFSFWNNYDPHRSGFKFHTAVLPVLPVIFQVQPSFLMIPLECFPVVVSKCFFKIFVTIMVALIVTDMLIWPTFFMSLYLNYRIVFSFLPPFAWHPLSADAITYISMSVFSL